LTEAAFPLKWVVVAASVVVKVGGVDVAAFS
jgi:hypothetical protein